MRRLLPTMVGILAVVAVIAIATVIGELSEDTPATTTPTIEYSQEPTTPPTHTDEPPSADSKTTPDDDQGHKQPKDHKSAKDKTNKTDGPPEWRQVIDGFATAFTKPGKHEPLKKWHKKLARWITPDLAAAYKSTDPRNLPDTTLADITIESQGDEAVTAIIRYRGLPPTWVIVQPTADGWRITQVEPYKQPTKNT